ncbi:hypothetical protein MBANPS3_007261 [Mucor bainieri]
MSTNTSLSNSTSNSTVCSTPECTTLANSILAFLDLNVDPCSDFYQYTCGGWLANATIPDDEFIVGPQKTALDTNQEAMRSILEGTYDDLYKDLIGSDEGFHREDQEDADKENFETMQKYYNVCMNTAEIETLGPTPVYQDVAKFENVLFPVSNDAQLFSNQTVPAFTQALSRLSALSIPALTTLFVDADSMKPEVNVIYFDQFKPGLPSKEYYEIPETLTVYKSGLTDILTKVLGNSSNGTENATLRDTESAKYNFTRWSEERIAASVERFIDFEAKLANISMKAEELRDPTATYNPLKLSDFQANNSYVDWTVLIESLLPSGDKVPDDNVTIRAMPYFERLDALLFSGNITERTLQEYCIINFVTNVAFTLDSPTREATRKLKSAISTGTTAEIPRWKTCTDAVSEGISNSMGRHFVLKRFGGEAERKKVETFLTNIHETWTDHLGQIDWLDNQTRSKAVEKVKAIEHMVAYSTVSPDLRQPNSIKEYNEGIYINETSYYDTEYLLKTWATKKKWAKAGKTVDRNEWLFSTQTVNAHYYASTNQIVMLAGMLTDPMYNTTQPEYLNYGGIGMVVAHEIAHAFDSMGREYDGKGVLTDWWTNVTSAQFEEKAKCFIDQYSKFTVPGPGNSTLNVNGALTLAENLADNGGGKLALTAYKRLDKQEQKLPGLENMSPEALYYVNLGRSWCTKQREEVDQLSIYTNTHSPDNVRVNGILQNSPEFAATFNCPAGSPMNPETKCSMW